MSNELLAKEALHHARTACVIKSTNKYHVNDPMKRLRTDASNTRVVALRDKYSQGGFSSFSEYGAACEAEGAGNCTEMALMAQNYVRQRGADARLIAVPPPGDHVFAVIGFQTGDELLPMSKWADDAYICDPWANIACAPSRYELLWKVKMRKWKADDKLISSGGIGIDPTSEPWFSSVTKRPYELLC